MTVAEATHILRGKGFNFSKGEVYYNGSGYRRKFSLEGSSEVPSVTPYMGSPTTSAAFGFITDEHGNYVRNFFYYTGSGFNTTKNINDFITQIYEQQRTG